MEDVMRLVKDKTKIDRKLFEYYPFWSPRVEEDTRLYVCLVFYKLRRITDFDHFDMYISKLFIS